MEFYLIENKQFLIAQITYALTSLSTEILQN